MIKRTDLYASLRPHAEEMQVNLGEVLFCEGDRGDSFYYVVSGQLRVLTRDSNDQMETIGYLFPGDHCGEGALLTGKTRRATVRAVEPSIVLKISQGGFHTLVSEHRELTPYLLDQVRDIAYRNFTKFIALDTVNLPEAMQLFFQCLERKVIVAEKKAVWRDEDAKRLYLIGRGTLRLRESDQPSKRLKPGDFFGGNSDQLTIETETEVVLYTLSHNDLARVLEKAPQIIRIFEKTDQNEQEEPRETVPQNGRIKTIEIEPENSISDQSPRKLRTYITFPYIKQHDETDCGAACLGMICQYYGQSIGLNRLRDMANVSREGTSLSALAEAAENLGFLTRGMCGLDTVKSEKETCPSSRTGKAITLSFCIASIQNAWIADPALGRRKITRKEFEDKWSKLALILEYTDKVSRYRGRKSSFRRFFPLARPYLGILTEILIASLVLNLFGLASPLFTQMILDQVLVHQDTSLLNLLLLGMIIIALFRIATSSLRNYLIGYVGARISISMLSHIYHHLLRLPMRFFALRRTGDIMTRFRESQYLRSLLTETSQPPDIEIEIQFRSAEVEHLKQRYEQNQKLYEKRLISLAALNEAKVRYLSALAELPARMAEINRYEVSLKDLKRQILEERLELERTRANFQNAYDIATIRLKRAKQAINRSVDADIDLILAPESGIITQVLVNTPGQVVNKGQTLVTIAPASTPIVAEALILNKDVGLLSSGQKVKLKFEAFPFQDYGIQHGYLRQISPDAMGDEDSGTVFRGIIDLENTTILVHGEEKAFMFGMKGTAEIITDRQSILMLALNPLRQLRDLTALSPEGRE